jgi:hypothetical protein
MPPLRPLPGGSVSARHFDLPARDARAHQRACLGFPGILAAWRSLRLQSVWEGISFGACLERPRAPAHS